jgi:hemerythrin-like domain-containing protein
MSEKSPIEELREEHSALGADAKDLKESVRGLGAGTGAAWSDVGGALAERVEMFRRSLLLHFRREEEGLFPEAKRMVSERARRADVMGRFFGEEGEEDIAAHAALASRVEDILALLDQVEKAGQIDDHSLARLRTLTDLTVGLLERHVQKEDTMIFPMVERSLDALQLSEVQQRMTGLASAQDLLTSSDGDLRGLEIGEE